MSNKPPIAIRVIKEEQSFFIATRASNNCFTFKQDSIKHDPIKALQRIAELMKVDVVITEVKPKTANISVEDVNFPNPDNDKMGCNCHGYSQKDEICLYFNRFDQKCILSKGKCEYQIKI